MTKPEHTEYENGWSDCKNSILELLEKICFTIAAQEPNRQNINQVLGWPDEASYRIATSQCKKA